MRGRRSAGGPVLDDARPGGFVPESETKPPTTGSYRARNTLRKRVKPVAEPNGRRRRLSSERSGFLPCIERLIHSAQSVSKVRSGSGAKPGSARVEPLSTPRCQGSASAKRHWTVSPSPLIESVRADRAIDSK